MAISTLSAGFQPGREVGVEGVVEVGLGGGGDGRGRLEDWKTGCR
jgi:hypothetical protein